MVAHRRGPWSQHEDQWLVGLVARNGPHNWVRISQEIGSRSPKQCRERYHQNLKPSLNHDAITAEEGDLIEKMVAEMGKRWAEIARRLKGRSDNAVKNWWNGGQNRRKRNPDRSDQPSREHAQHLQQAYRYPSAHHVVPPYDEHHMRSYHASPRPSLSSPSALKLPQPRCFEPYPGTRPQPLDVSAYGAYSMARARGLETPMPSPSGYSIVSSDGAPSLITDTGSESRSPRAAASPLEATLAPLTGNRDERKSSSYSRFPPFPSYALEEEAPLDFSRRRYSLQLPPLQRSEAGTVLAAAAGAAATFREPMYDCVQPSPSLPQPASQFLHPHTVPQPAPLSVPQHSLPSFHSLAEPVLPAPHHGSATISPLPRQFPSPPVHAAMPLASMSTPTSPKDKMKLKNIL